MPGPAGPSPKLLGRIAAGLLAFVFVGIVWRAVSTSAPAVKPNNIVDLGDAPDITEFETGESIVITLADKQDPGRVAGIIEADRFDPVGNGQRELVNPRGWLYPRDGRVIRVRADRGLLTMPTANSSPEAGTLEGDVQVLVFSESPGPGIPPLDSTTPVMTATFEQPVQFESRYLRLSTPGAFRIESERLSFDGIGLSVMLNGVRDRIELIDVERGGRMEVLVASNESPLPVDPDSSESAESSPVELATPIATTTPSTVPIAEVSKIDMYRAVLDSEVVATLGTTRVEGERLELFTRVRDNAIADDAFAAVGFRRSAEPSPGDISTPNDSDSTTGFDAPILDSSPLASSETAAIEPGPPADPERMVLVWQGSMTIRPIGDDATPDELIENDAALALYGNENKAVQFRDDVQGIEGRADVARYAATQGVFTLESGTDPVSAVIADAGSGTFDRVDADLVRGLIRFTGAGQGESRTGASLRWSDAGELTLAKDSNGDVTDRLTDAAFEGNVRAAQRSGAIEGERLHTSFGLGSDGRAALRNARIDQGRIVGEPDEVSRPRLLSGSLIKVDFTGNAGTPEPIRVEAIGSATKPIRGEANGSTLTAEKSVATLTRNGAGDLFVRTADAQGGVSFRGENDTRANGAELLVDGSRETIRLTGTDSTVAQGDSTIRGSDIRLDARTRQMNVAGLGRFEHTLRTDEGIASGKVVASWNESMRFDDALGKLICLGGVTVVATPDPYTRDTLSAERIEVEMTPRLTPDRIGGRGAGKRELTLARAFGGTTPDGPKPASAKTTKYDPANPEFVIGRLYLESDQIIADARQSELRVPGAGTLLLLDRQSDNDDNKDASQSPESAPSGLGPGLTRFGWDGSMTLDRASGVGTMFDNVSVRHKALTHTDGSSKIADLLCDRLTASFEAASEESSDPASDEPRFVLDTLDAQGNVLFAADGKQLEADGANYDAARQILHTLASPGRLVTLTEPGRAAPLSARAIKWNLSTDQIEINQPSPVTLPGG